MNLVPVKATICIIGFLDAWTGNQKLIWTGDIKEIHDNPSLSPTCPDNTTSITLKDYSITCAPFSFQEWQYKVDKFCANEVNK